MRAIDRGVEAVRVEDLGQNVQGGRQPGAGPIEKVVAIGPVHMARLHGAEGGPPVVVSENVHLRIGPGQAEPTRHHDDAVRVGLVQGVEVAAATGKDRRPARRLQKQLLNNISDARDQERIANAVYCL